MSKKIDDEKIKKIYQLYESGFSNREIAKQLDLHWGTIATYLKKKNLKSNWNKTQHVDVVNDKEARCSHCLKIKPIGEFIHGRKGQKYEYRYSYCNNCRSQKTKFRLNNDVYGYIKFRVGSLRRKIRRKSDRRYGLNFDLNSDYVIKIYNKQSGKCFYTGYDLVCQYGKGINRNTLSFDRLIPELGYIKGNIVLCT